MTSIRVRLLLFGTLFAGTTLALADSAYNSFESLKSRRNQMEISYAIRNEIQNINEIKSSGDKFRKLQDYRAQLWPERRMEEFSNLLQAINEGSPRLISKRHEVVIKNEIEFQRFTRLEMDFLEKRLLYFGSLSLLILTLGFAFLQYFMNRVVVLPINSLSRKMVDFLNDRYTYQYSVPAPDEIGHMHSTFNSLAQRVISNMEQLRTLDQAKSEFLSIASHELRTPLTSIKGSLSLMRSGIVGEMNEMAENLLSIAETETDRLIRLINDILDLAKIEAGKLPLTLEWVKWDELASTSLNSLQGLAQQADIKFAMEHASTIELQIDRDRVQQVLTNLLSNAIKFSPKGAVVKVSAHVTEQNLLQIEVSDQGRGIAPEDQELIFQKFRQVTNSKNPLVKGTGLGLAIARALVEEHGGEINLRSTPGEGSTFYFTLPEWRYAARAIDEVAA